MNNNWEIKELKDVCQIGAGNSAPQKKEMFDNGIYPFFRTSDVGKIHLGFVKDSTDKLNKLGIKKLKLYRKGTLLFPKSEASTFLNHRVLMDVDGYVSSHLATLKANNDYLDDQFLLYFSMNVDSRELMQDQNYPSLRLSDIQTIKMFLPSLPEQRRIVKILNEAFLAVGKAKANAEKNLQNSRKLFDSYLNKVFTNPGKDWEERKLGEIATFRNGMNFTKRSKGETIKIVGVKDFQKSFWVPFEYLDAVTIAGKLKESDFLKEDDLLAVRSNGNPELIGRTLLAGNVLGKVSHSGFTIRIRLNSRIIFPLYLCHYLKADRTRKELVKSGTGINIKSLNQGALSSLLISFPKSQTEQRAIVQELDVLSAETIKLIAIYQQKLTDLEELKNSILQKAFDGHL